MTAHRSNPRNDTASAARWRRVVKGVLVVVLVGSYLVLTADHPRASSDAGVSAAPATGRQTGRLIRLQGYEFDPLAQMPPLPSGLRYEQPGMTEATYYIVQFDGRVTPQMRGEVEAA